jgi:hypothetical protein
LLLAGPLIFLVQRLALKSRACAADRAYPASGTIRGLACLDPAWLAPTATDQEIQFTAGSDDLYLLMCSDCGGSITAPSAKVNEVNFSAPP